MVFYARNAEGVLRPSEAPDLNSSFADNDLVFVGLK